MLKKEQTQAANDIPGIQSELLVDDSEDSTKSE